MFDDFTKMNADSILSLNKYESIKYGLGKQRNNKKQLTEMKRKEIAKRRKRRLMYGRS